jgi:hypothetical protein
MAERVEIELVDDIDGTAAEQTVTFALDGAVYEIDLNRTHAKQLRTVLKPYVNKARSTETGAERRSASGTQREQRRRRQTNRDLTSQIRQAAQRSREQVKTRHGKARQQADTTTPTANERQRPVTPSTSVEPHTEPATARAERKHTEPPVPLPQFSSAP